ncbi:2'-5' RNA ligase family protein [Leifsonia sp. NPDC056665]|uniref:2'-5' RNA ligase family protein n=1 Tax=Leifsonia sp. NPDC056665 TaxID=3345901 RepID=UPI0036C4DA4F
MNAFAAVALFAPIEVGTAIPRSAWPAHLTLVSNFVVGASPERVIQVVRDALVDSPPVEARIAGRAMFGPAADIPVQLVEPGPFPGVHEALAEAVERLPGFVADEPGYWHDGYRAHITLRAGESLREGDAWPVRCFAAVQLTEEYGAIIDVVNVGWE